MHSHWRPSEPDWTPCARGQRSRASCATRKASRSSSAGRLSSPSTAPSTTSSSAWRRWSVGGISTAVRPLLGGFQWIERLPGEESMPLVGSSMTASRRCAVAHEAVASRPTLLASAGVTAATAELERAIPALPGISTPSRSATGRVLTYADASKMRPILEAANRHRAMLFIHYGPKPGDAFPRVPNDTDNARRRNGTLDMQANLSSAMVTLCLTDILAPIRMRRIHVHNLGGNIPYEVERMDHRCHAGHARRGTALGALRALAGVRGLQLVWARGPSRPACGCTAPTASCSAPTAPSSVYERSGKAHGRCRYRRRCQRRRSLQSERAQARWHIACRWRSSSRRIDATVFIPSRDANGGSNPSDRST